MRGGPQWMTKSDDRILEVLDDLGAALSMRGIEINSKILDNRVPYGTINDRLPKLIDAGLITTVDEHEQWYMISENGSAYLDGDYVPPDLS